MVEENLYNMKFPITQWTQQCVSWFNTLFEEPTTNKTEEILRLFLLFKREIKSCRTEWQLRNVEDLMELMFVDKYKPEDIQYYLEKLKRIIKRMRVLIPLYQTTNFTTSLN